MISFLRFLSHLLFQCCLHVVVKPFVKVSDLSDAEYLLAQRARIMLRSPHLDALHVEVMAYIAWQNSQSRLFGLERYKADDAIIVLCKFHWIKGSSNLLE